MNFVIACVRLSPGRKEMARSEDTMMIPAEVWAQGTRGCSARGPAKTVTTPRLQGARGGNGFSGTERMPLPPTGEVQSKREPR